jgi:putative transposase
MEDLNISGMVKNHKLAKAISSVGWGMFKNKLSQKLNELGGLLLNIDRFDPSTKMCSSCGTLNNNLTLKDREWDCCCGVYHDRDINAAINIKEMGLKNRLGTSQIHGYGDITSGIDLKNQLVIYH